MKMKLQQTKTLSQGKIFLFTLAFSLITEHAISPLGNQVCFNLSENFVFFEFHKDLLIIQLWNNFVPE